MKSFMEVTTLLPPELQEPLQLLPQDAKTGIEEIRLRAGQPMSVVGEKAVQMDGYRITPDCLYDVLEHASRHSVHTVLERMSSGFVSVKGGHRIGLCGVAVTEEGTCRGFRQISSLNLRIAREKTGIAEPIAAQLFREGRMENTLIAAPPGAGKTTLLRDLIRCLSGGHTVPAQRVSVVDERGELAAIWEGVPQMEMGENTDILEGVKKGEAIPMLLRGMNPQVIAVDEITDFEDVKRIKEAAGCGVSIVATAHGKSVKEMRLRPVYRELLECGMFRKAIMIERIRNGVRSIAVEEVL